MRWCRLWCRYSIQRPTPSRIYIYIPTRNPCQVAGFMQSNNWIRLVVSVAIKCGLNYTNTYSKTPHKFSGKEKKPSPIFTPIGHIALGKYCGERNPYWQLDNSNHPIYPRAWEASAHHSLEPARLTNRFVIQLTSLIYGNAIMTMAIATHSMVSRECKH